ncbi:MAG: hypothetical protein WD875_17290 [Pirellulales bacterium]
MMRRLGRTSNRRNLGQKPRGASAADEAEPAADASKPSTSEGDGDGDGRHAFTGFGECDDDLDVQSFDPNAGDVLGDFGLDDEEAVPEADDFWFDDADADDADSFGN